MAGYTLITFPISRSISRCFMKKNVKRVDIPLHSFHHFHEILILNSVSVLIYARRNKKPLTFHQKTCHFKRNDMKYEMRKRCSVLYARHTLHTFHFFIFRGRFTAFRDKCVASRWRISQSIFFAFYILHDFARGGGF